MSCSSGWLKPAAEADEAKRPLKKTMIDNDSSDDEAAVLSSAVRAFLWVCAGMCLQHLCVCVWVCVSVFFRLMCVRCLGAFPAMSHLTRPLVRAFLPQPAKRSKAAVLASDDEDDAPSAPSQTHTAAAASPEPCIKAAGKRSVEQSPAATSDKAEGHTEETPMRAAASNAEEKDAAERKDTGFQAYLTAKVCVRPPLLPLWPAMGRLLP